MGIFEDVGRMGGEAMAKYNDMFMEHISHVLEETEVTSCDICMNPDKYIVPMHTCTCGDEHPLVDKGGAGG